MHCTACGTELGDPQQFCPKCGASLGAVLQKAARPPSAPRSGGFHRFTLGAFSVWTGLWLGGAIAGMVKVSEHGNISGAGAIGVGLGLGMMAVIWFVPAVVLGLIAIATKPSPHVPWPTVTKVTTAVLTGLAFLGPMAQISERDRSPAAIQDKGSPDSKSRWTVSTKEDPTEDTLETTFSLPSDDGTASLAIRCTEDVKFGDGHGGVSREFYIHTASYIAPDSEMTIRLDDNQPIHNLGYHSTNYKAMFFLDDVMIHSLADFIPRVLAAKRALIKLTIFQSTEHVWAFSPSGADVEQIVRTCKLQQKRARP